MRSRNSSSVRISFFQSMMAGASARLITEILGAGQRRHQSEVLIDHADAERAGIARIADRHLGAVEQDLAFVGRVEAHDAFDQRRLAGAVLAQKRMHGAGLDVDGDVFERDQRAEDLGHADGFE